MKKFAKILEFDNHQVLIVRGINFDGRYCLAVTIDPEFTPNIFSQEKLFLTEKERDDEYNSFDIEIAKTLRNKMIKELV